MATRPTEYEESQTRAKQEDEKRFLKDALYGEKDELSPNKAHAAELKEKAHNYSVDEDKDPTDAGMIKTAESMARESHEDAKEEQEKKKEKELKNLLHLIDALEKQNAQWAAEIADNMAKIKENEAKIGENNEALEAIDKLKELTESGEFDEENPEHVALLKKAGLTLKEYKENPTEALGKREEALKRENKALEKENDQLNKRNDNLGTKIKRNETEIENAQSKQRVKTLDPHEAAEKDNLLSDNIGLKREEIDIQDDLAINHREEYLEQEADVATVDKEKEIKDFMVGLKKAELIDNNIERLKFEKELLDKLPEEAVEVVSWDSDASRLFEDGYFSAIEQEGNSGVSKEATQKISGPQILPS